jgi:hypothetical protein
MEQAPFKSELRLIFQGSIPIDTDIEGDIEYLNLKIFLKAINPNVSLNGQVMKMLEPCCKEKTKNANT